MAAPPRIPGGSDTLNRDVWIDVNSGTHADPDWIPVNQWQELKLSITPTKQDSSDFDSEGYKDEAVTAIEWGIEGKVGRKSLAADGTAYDVGQEMLRVAAFELGAGNRVELRIYEMGGGVGGGGENPRVESYQGYANVQWVPDGGGMETLKTVSVTLGGKGALTPISTPDTGTPPAPVISGISPSTGLNTAGGELITITLSNAASVTAVTVGGTAVGDFAIVGGSTIVALTPAKSAASYDVVATNPGGASAAGVQVTYV